MQIDDSDQGEENGAFCYGSNLSTADAIDVTLDDDVQDDETFDDALNDDEEKEAFNYTTDDSDRSSSISYSDADD